MNDNQVVRARSYFNWVTVLHAEVSNLAYLFKKNIGINITQATIILILTTFEDGVKMGDLSRFLTLSPNTLTASVNMLEEYGYIKRHRSADDQRVVYIEITEAGRNLLPGIKESLDLHFKSVAKVINNDEWKFAVDAITSYQNPPLIDVYDEPLNTYAGGLIVVRNIMLKLSQRAKTYDLSLNEARILFYIACSDEVKNLSDISRKLYIRQNALTIYISRLDKDKLIKRIINNVDKRTTTISLTKKGQDIIDSIYEVIDKYLVANNLDFAVNPPAALLEFNYMSIRFSYLRYKCITGFIKQSIKETGENTW